MRKIKSPRPAAKSRKQVHLWVPALGRRSVTPPRVETCSTSAGRGRDGRRRRGCRASLRRSLAMSGLRGNWSADGLTSEPILREIPPNKLSEVFQQEPICSLTDWSVRYHHVERVKRAIKYLEFNWNIGPTKVLNVGFRFIPKWLYTADVSDRWRQFRIVCTARRSCVRRHVPHAIEITRPASLLAFASQTGALFPTTEALFCRSSIIG
jgi:hypothetical protein